MESWHQAIDDFTKAIEFNSDSAIYFYYRGKCEIKVKLKSKACEDFNSAKDMGLDDAEKEIDLYCHLKY
jgi:hypothetical protein